jgi:hypothetical protein
MKKLIIAYLFFFYLIVSSCNYYKVDKSYPNGIGLAAALDREKIIIMHTSDGVYHLTNPVINENGNILTGIAVNLGAKYAKRRQVKKSVNRYNKSKETPHKEVHIFVSQYAKKDSSNQILVQTEDIKRMDVYKNQFWLGIIATYALGFIIFLGAWFISYMWLSYLSGY